jgi:uncharacterized membrane protein (TIGR02234 family)
VTVPAQASAPDAPSDTDAASVAATRPSRRALTTTALLAILGAVLAWVVAGRVWARGGVGGAENTLLVSATGNDLSGAVTALALTAIAGSLALFATHKLGRQLVGLLLTAVGVGIVASAASAHGTAHARTVLAAKATAKGVGGAVEHFSGNAYWLAAVCGGVIVAAAGLLTVVRGRTWPAMSSRYDTPAVRAAKAEAHAAAQVNTAKGLWDALDRGEDPTGEPGVAPAPRSEH